MHRKRLIYLINHSIPYILSITFLEILRIIFRFDRWHISPIIERKYAQDLVCFLNQLPKIDEMSVAEIGCGLGSIIGRIKSKTKIGYDQELAAIKAARFISQISWNKTVFETFNFPSDELSSEIDILIMVNWIHNIPPETIKLGFLNFFDNHIKRTGMLIADSVDYEGYKYFHNFGEMFDPSVFHCQCLGSYPSNRKIWAIRKL